METRSNEHARNRLRGTYMLYTIINQEWNAELQMTFRLKCFQILLQKDPQNCALAVGFRNNAIKLKNSNYPNSWSSH